MTHRFTILLVLAVVLLLIAPAYAQYRASIRGVVTDPQGAVVQGATVTLLNTDTNLAMTATSDVYGIYVFNAIPAAHYKITVERTGFKKKVLEKVEIIPDQLNALDLQLELGQAQETVTVSATTETVDTQTATTGTTISSSEVANMPSFGRDVFKLIQLAPGVFGDNSQSSGGGGSNLPGTAGPGATGSNVGIFGTENGPQAVAGGQGYQNNGISLDGISTASAVWGGTTIITPSEDAVQEVKVVSNAYDAENGRFSGVQIQVTSKSGSNQLHGSAFFTAHRPGLNAYQSWNGNNGSVQRDSNFFSQFGVSAGGPIWKNKVFGFFAWETIRSPAAQTNSSSAWFETPNVTAPSGSIASKYLTFAGSRPNSTSINPKTCGDIGLSATFCQTTAQGLDIGSPLPLATGLGKQDLGYSTNLSPGVGNGLDGIADIANYNFTSTSHYTKNQYVGRVDAYLTQNDRLAGSIYWVPQSTDSQNGNRPYDAFHHTQVNNAFSLIWNRTISPTFVNEARFNAAGWRYNEVASNPQAPVGLPQDFIDNVGNIGITGFAPPVGSILNQWTYSYKDVATKVIGRHSIKFGGEITRLYYLQQCVSCAVPRYNFYNFWDFVNDAPREEAVSVNPLTGAPSSGRQDQRENIWGFFVQDDFQLRRNLTINLGLRWSYFGPLSSKEGNMYRAVPGAGTAFLSGLTVVKGNFANAEKGNFGPQIGFAWSPGWFKDKLVVRGGYGLSYNQEEIAISANISSNPGLTVGKDLTSASPTSINPNIVYAAAGDVHSYSYPPNTAFITTLGPDGLPTTGSPVSIFIFPQTVPTMHVHHFSLDSQYDFGHDWLATLGYQGSLSRNILSNAQIGPYAASKGYLPPNPHIEYNGWDNYWNTNGYGNYNAMLAELKHRFGHGLLFDLQFTWSKTMDTTTGPYTEQYFPSDPALSYGRSDNNVGRAWKIYGSYSPTFFRGQRTWMEKVVGGWTLTGIFNLHSGFPWNPIYSFGGSMYCGACWYGSLYPGAYLGGAGSSTSNSAFMTGSNYPMGGAHYFSVPTYTSFSNLGDWGSAATNPVLGVHRNSLTGPGYRSLDASLIKAFGLPKAPILGEGAKLEFRVDAYNLFNNLNLNPTSIDKNIGTPSSPNLNFGKVSGALGARVVTLGARFNF